MAIKIGLECEESTSRLLTRPPLHFTMDGIHFRLICGFNREEKFVNCVLIYGGGQFEEYPWMGTLDLFRELLEKLKIAKEKIHSVNKIQITTNFKTPSHDENRNVILDISIKNKGFFGKTSITIVESLYYVGANLEIDSVIKFFETTLEYFDDWFEHKKIDSNSKKSLKL